MQISHTFRNRTSDYTRQNLSTLPIPQTPAGFPAPPFSPQHTIPAGPATYLASQYPDMTPPGFKETIPIPALPPTIKVAHS